MATTTMATTTRLHKRKLRDEVFSTVSVITIVEHQVRVARDKVWATAAARVPSSEQTTTLETWIVVSRC
jgi:hypothetical protein